MPTPDITKSKSFPKGWWVETTKVFHAERRGGQIVNTPYWRVGLYKNGILAVHRDFHQMGEKVEILVKELQKLVEGREHGG